MPSSPTPRLLIGLVATLIMAAVFSLWALQQLDGLRRLQTHTIDRNRAEIIALLRAQSALDSVRFSLHDVVAGEQHQRIAEWRSESARLHQEISKVLALPGAVQISPERDRIAAAGHRLGEGLHSVAVLAERGDRRGAGELIHSSLEEAYQAISSDIGRLTAKVSESEREAVKQIERVYEQAEANVYLFLAAMLAGITAIGLAVLHDTRRMFSRAEKLSLQRSTLARRVIEAQEEVFRSVSRELHDEFGQILTATGALLRRAEKHADNPTVVRAEVQEVKLMAQQALDKTRSLSQALHPSVLDDYGFERAVERYVPTFEKHTGISVRLDKEGSGPVPDDKAIHVFRVLQESLNNVARHSHAKKVSIRVRFADEKLRLEVQDDGIGIGEHPNHGIGLTGMRERAEIVNGKLQISDAPGGGTLVQLEVPLKDGHG